MHPPIPRWAPAAALALCLLPGNALAGALAAPLSGEDTTRIQLDAGPGATLLTSVFDSEPLRAVGTAWFDEAAPAPVAKPVAPLRGMALEDPSEILRRHAAGEGVLSSGFRRGSTVVDAWYLLAVPFLLPIILRRRHRRAARSWTDQIEQAGRSAEESALDAIVRSPYEASSLT